MSKVDVFRRLKPLLVEAIPRSFASLKIRRPLCRLRVYYYDTHAPCIYLWLRAASAEWRTQFLAEKGERARDYLWSSGEDGGDGPDIDFPGSGEIAKLFAEVYALLCDNEDKYMVPFREMLQRVCRQLNGIDWQAICPVTDDFVVVPADGSTHFGDDSEDIVRSVPAARLKLLRSSGFGLPEDWSS